MSPGSSASLERRRRATASVIVALIIALGATAAAQPSGQAAAATSQFDRGRALMKDKKYAEACAAFEHSQKLDPQWGTLYNLAGCYARIGKLASAWAAYRELAQRDTNPARRKESAKQARDLDRRLPRLLLTAARAPAGLAVTLDGVDATGLLGTESPVDLGEHAVHATAPNRADFDATATITGEGKTVVLAIELAPAKPRPEVVPVPAPREPTQAAAPAQPGPRAQAAAPVPGSDHDAASRDDAGPPRSRRRMYGVIVAAGGGALVVTGLVFGRLASSKWSEAKALCGDDLMCDNQADLAAGNQLVSEARSRAVLSTGFVIGGVAAIGLGAVLFATAPRGDARATALRLTPGVAPGLVSLTVEGRY